MIKRIYIVLITIYISVCTISGLKLNPKKIYDEGRLSFSAIGASYGYPVEELDVVTEDGFILKIFHIAGDKRRPVLLLHGFIDCADTFIIRGNKSLAITLANNGYDVWALNARGTRYSRNHIHLNPDIDLKFWDFSFHEMGYYDLPAAIDFVLERTTERQLSAIGHSQGNTLFYVLGSTRPEYNDKIKVMIALAPVCFLNYVNPPVSSLIATIPIIGNVLRSVKTEELFSDNSLLRHLFQMLCTQREIGYQICGHGLLFALGGSDPDELEPEFLPIVVAHYPTSTSRKNGVHVGQVGLTKKFVQFDYGPLKNVAIYNAISPPNYDLRKVKMKIALLLGRNDGISTIEDAELLRNELFNVVDYLVLPYKNLNHIDLVWGQNMDKYLFPYIFSILETYK
ncbi:unnamed protein product [Parnassius mnemosyne]|uniref:Lipase n=1 Tax=Parnassius mnemosyne TaxID=213953 RepID=A0AAV1K9W5_9NEOP